MCIYTLNFIFCSSVNKIASSDEEYELPEIPGTKYPWMDIDEPITDTTGPSNTEQR